MQPSCLAVPAEERLDARSCLFNTVRADYRPKLVRVNEARIQELEFPKREFRPMATGLPGTGPGGKLVDAIAYILILNSQNFQFWDIVNGRFVRYEYEGLTGATGMRRAFNQAWGDEATTARFRRVLAEHGVRGVFGAISQPEEREAIFAEMFTKRWVETLAETLADTATTAKSFGLKDARLIADVFPRSYSDPYLKRAQLALAEIVGFCHETGLSVNCSELTLCADYQLPRVLRALGVLEYAPQIEELVDSQTLIEKDSEEERAIRAGTIVAGEAMAEHFECTAAAVDNFLWTNRGQVSPAPFHLTVTTAY